MLNLFEAPGHLPDAKDVTKFIFFKANDKQINIKASSSDCVWFIIIELREFQEVSLYMSSKIESSDLLNKFSYFI